MTWNQANQSWSCFHLRIEGYESPLNHLPNSWAVGLGFFHACEDCAKSAPKSPPDSCFCQSGDKKNSANVVPRAGDEFAAGAASVLSLVPEQKEEKPRL
jgi:hypothetical protein